MSKYSDDQLQEMATTALEAKFSGDIRYVQLVVSIQLKTGMTSTEIESNIVRLAKGE